MSDVNSRSSFAADNARMSLLCIAKSLRPGCQKSIQAAAVFALQAAFGSEEGDDLHEQYRTIVGMVVSGRTSQENLCRALDAVLFAGTAPTGSRFVDEFGRREPGFALEADPSGLPRIYNPDGIRVARGGASPRRSPVVSPSGFRLHVG